LHNLGVFLKVLLLRPYRLNLQPSDVEVCCQLQFAMSPAQWRNFLREFWLPQWLTLPSGFEFALHVLSVLKLGLKLVEMLRRPANICPSE
jgi:hypothetical protein